MTRQALNSIIYNNKEYVILENLDFKLNQIVETLLINSGIKPKMHTTSCIAGYIYTCKVKDDNTFVIDNITVWQKYLPPVNGIKPIYQSKTGMASTFENVEYKPDYVGNIIIGYWNSFMKEYETNIFGLPPQYLFQDILKLYIKGNHVYFAEDISKEMAIEREKRMPEILETLKQWEINYKHSLNSYKINKKE
ncbi:MAG: hypothetical protein IJV46_00205 [Acidaminococcaceae bacterium]|nr:hypothetical protein [Acidaminococcaceae bacterium]